MTCSFRKACESQCVRSRRAGFVLTFDDTMTSWRVLRSDDILVTFAAGTDLRT